MYEPRPIDTSEVVLLDELLVLAEKCPDVVQYSARLEAVRKLIVKELIDKSMGGLGIL